jgi:AcrR family transcriptional regulator
MSFWQKVQRILSTLKELGSASIRKLAEVTGLSKSSVDRHLKAKARRNQHPESPLWETEEGHAWLSRLVTATLLDFGIKRGVGLEGIAEFFQHVRIGTHVGISPTALRGVQQRLEALIVTYGQEQQAHGLKAGQPQDIVGGVDETFFEQMVLVMLDLVSGYLLLEEFSSSRTTQTWQKRLAQVLQTFSVRVRYLVSDRAKALIKLALEYVGCRSIADLFHALHEVAQGFSFAIQTRLDQAQRELETVRETLAKLPGEPTPPRVHAVEQQQQLEQTVQHWQTVQTDYRGLLQEFSQSVHPFAVTSLAPQTSASVARQLRQTVEQLETLAQRNDLPHADKHLKPVKRLIDDLASLMTVWWDWVDHSLADTVRDPLMQLWLKETLLPKVYWEHQLRQCRSSTQRPVYRAAWEQAGQKFAAHPRTAQWDADGLAYWTHWAETMTARFQRTSSAVEGRNGYLSQINHACRGLSTDDLKVLTVLHNFELRRADGTTAAERFFDLSFPDLFEWLLPRIGELPLPRKSRRSSAHAPT